jgi:hypothetical protein
MKLYMALATALGLMFGSMAIADVGFSIGIGGYPYQRDYNRYDSYPYYNTYRTYDYDDNDYNYRYRYPTYYSYRYYTYPNYYAYPYGTTIYYGR